jgi:Kef-type K+ transport system membrane component KefB
MTAPDSLLPKSTSPRRTLAIYGAVLAAAAVLYFAVRWRGEQLGAPAAPAGAPEIHATSAHSAVFAEVLLALATIVLTARAVGYLFDRYLKQPPVIGEIAAGLMLGPSLLGAISEPLYHFVLPPEAAPHLGIVAKIGVVLFMFLVGLELDLRVLRGTTHLTLAISHASIVAPFILGASLALLLYPIYSHDGVSFTVFSLFLGVSMSVTAFPVLARILTDRRMQRSPLGTTALACAAIDDATAWCLLALVSGVATASIQAPMITLALVVGYVAVMWLGVRPLIRRVSQRHDGQREEVSLSLLALVFGGLLLSAVATERIGIHALFGAFVFGALFPSEGKLAEQLRMRLDDLVVVLLLPVFFAFTGMRTQLGLLSEPMDWALAGLVIVVATLGKLGGTAVAARFAGMSLRESAALGVLMNTRGLMELIVLNVGLDMGVLSPRLFAMFVLMALVTTFGTTPVLNLLMRTQRSSTDARQSPCPDAGTL